MRIVPTGRPVLADAPSNVDIVVVGAGAAGIAAACALIARGCSVVVLEARDRVGGRAVTARLAGHPIDLGAHWLHAGALNPLVRLGAERGEPLRRAPVGAHLVRDGRFASRAARRANGVAFDKMDEAVAVAARNEDDASLESVQAFLGPDRRAIRSTFTLVSGRSLREVSAQDFPSEEFGDNWFVRGGYGAFLSRLAVGLPIRTGCAVHGLDWSGQGVAVSTSGGTVSAAAAIVTVPATVLASGRIAFRPALPSDTEAALAGFLPGTYEHVVLNWPGAPFRGPDRLAKLQSSRSTLGMMTRIDDAPFHYAELGHDDVPPSHGPERSAAMGRHVRSAIAEAFGARALDRMRVLAVTNWLDDPWSLGAWAVAPPGHHGARAVLSRPVGERIWFAGEANRPSMWGTVGGAWEAGELAAAEAAAAMGRRSR